MSEISQTRPLDGKVAVITGAGRGIGRAIAVAYAQAGAAVVCSARKEGELGVTLALIEKAGGRASIFTADVVEHAQMLALFDHAVATYGGIDIVLANAGTAGEGRKLQKSDPAQWRETIEVNLVGAYNTVHAAIPHLRARGAGKIIVTGSGSRHRAMPGLSAYASSKSALWMMAQVLAVELEEFNISVNELIPGPVKTAMTRFGEQSFPPQEWIKEPEDVVPLAMFLATQPDRGPTAQSYSLMRRA
ncbi:SDR family NAD(P)-dependent oxidoreductase [Rhodoferax sediminis]|uniref:SDR family NAD(P)-dependent oxidoreductase n=1 Tax=Rhodoferax sediminis TaxID=2509614 RepID=A0A515DDI5_9BURK|nr:SDR family NAD(P)-dependent oxidoreductase [Rhodoferax sediminis]QDL38492.1 SDR family NAD(P)-dependent oxidoreductase [Rhodoferax sediminis]